MGDVTQAVNPAMSNEDIASFFLRLADALEAKGELRFKIAAYRKAAQAMAADERSIVTLWQNGELRSIKGVGDAIEKKIGEILTTGRLRVLDELTQQGQATGA